jgi:H+/Cl- antiporter ClcA
MELTDNHDFVLPIMASCLIARACSNVVSKTPVYRAFAERLLREREREVAQAER